MMTIDDLDALETLAAKATPAPWHVCFTDDDHCMSMVVISTDPDLDALNDLATGETVVAATLVQAPRYVCVEDGKWDENAELIARVRNVLPEFLRLARLGLNQHVPSHY